MSAPQGEWTLLRLLLMFGTLSLFTLGCGAAARPVATTVPEVRSPAQSLSAGKSEGDGELPTPEMADERAPW
jgi:hypothetical protein